MTFVLIVLSLVWIIAGTSLILDTEKTRGLFPGLVTGENIRPLAVVALILGVSLVFGSFASARHFWVPFLVGLLAIAKGVYLLRAPRARVEALLHWWASRADKRTLRLWGIVALILGSALLSHLIG